MYFIKALPVRDGFSFSVSHSGFAARGHVVQIGGIKGFILLIFNSVFSLWFEPWLHLDIRQCCSSDFTLHSKSVCLHTVSPTKNNNTLSIQYMYAGQEHS